MRSKVLSIILTALITSLILLAVEAILKDHTPNFVPQASAQNIVSGHYYEVTQDTFILTSNSSGTEIFMYYCDVNMGEKEKSTIKFITKTKAP